MLHTLYSGRLLGPCGPSPNHALPPSPVSRPRHDVQDHPSAVPPCPRAAARARHSRPPRGPPARLPVARAAGFGLLRIWFTRAASSSSLSVLGSCSQKKSRRSDDVNLSTYTRPVVHCGTRSNLASSGKRIRSWRRARPSPPAARQRGRDAAARGTAGVYLFHGASLAVLPVQVQQVVCHLRVRVHAPPQSASTSPPSAPWRAADARVPLRCLRPCTTGPCAGPP